MDLQEIQVGAVKVSLFAQEDRIVTHIRDGKVFEPDSLAEWAAMCAQGGTVLDIGAYSGLFGIAAAKLGCKVFAFEPMPLNVKRLRENAKRNGVKIEIAECVVSNFTGPSSITFNSKVVGLTAGASLIRKKGYQHPVHSLTVDSLMLDDVRAIKIDVERAEPLVLEGAKETLERCRPAMLVEALGPYEGAAVQAAVLGYRVQRVLDVRNLLMAPC